MSCKIILDEIAEINSDYPIYWLLKGCSLISNKNISKSELISVENLIFKLEMFLENNSFNKNMKFLLNFLFRNFQILKLFYN